jgi:cytochrome c556
MKMAKKAILVTITAISSVAMTAAVLAQGGGGRRPNPDQTAVQFREALMTLINGTAGPLMGMQRGRVPYNAELVAKNARILTTLAGMIPDAFEHDTSSAQVKTMALPVVWQNHDEFLTTAGKLKTQVDALDKAVRGGSQDDVKAAIMNVGAVCGECHMKFRQAPPGGGGGGGGGGR